MKNDTIRRRFKTEPPQAWSGCTSVGVDVGADAGGDVGKGSGGSWLLQPFPAGQPWGDATAGGLPLLLSSLSPAFDSLLAASFGCDAGDGDGGRGCGCGSSRWCWCWRWRAAGLSLLLALCAVADGWAARPDTASCGVVVVVVVVVVGASVVDADVVVVVGAAGARKDELALLSKV